ncbi:unnamed protein product [Soboliphyme baturini]|uniref:Uncharacterized protein n=1 Tax=Soboliphyme baturini TaxID=241478 RepID=A0A183IRS4_9BILA|nr:unnamed protein product [Soboliphyme baturini]
MIGGGGDQTIEAETSIGVAGEELRPVPLTARTSVTSHFICGGGKNRPLVGFSFSKLRRRLAEAVGDRQGRPLELKLTCARSAFWAVQAAAATSADSATSPSNLFVEFFTSLRIVLTFEEAFDVYRAGTSAQANLVSSGPNSPSRSMPHSYPSQFPHSFRLFVPLLPYTSKMNSGCTGPCSADFLFHLAAMRPYSVIVNRVASVMTCDLTCTFVGLCKKWQTRRPAVLFKGAQDKFLAVLESVHRTRITLCIEHRIRTSKRSTLLADPQAVGLNRDEDTSGMSALFQSPPRKSHKH